MIFCNPFWQPLRIYIPQFLIWFQKKPFYYLLRKSWDRSFGNEMIWMSGCNFWWVKMDRNLAYCLPFLRKRKLTFYWRKTWSLHLPISTSVLFYPRISDPVAYSEFLNFWIIIWQSIAPKIVNFLTHFNNYNSSVSNRKKKKILFLLLWKQTIKFAIEITQLIHHNSMHRYNYKF